MTSVGTGTWALIGAAFGPTADNRAAGGRQGGAPRGTLRDVRPR